MKQNELISDTLHILSRQIDEQDQKGKTVSRGLSVDLQSLSLMLKQNSKQMDSIHKDQESRINQLEAASRNLQLIVQLLIGLAAIGITALVWAYLFRDAAK